MVQQINPPQLAAKRKAGEPVHLLDVRQPWEHETAALPDSQLIPLDQLMHRAAEVRPPAGSLVVVYCHHGIRSLSAAAYLERLGFTNVASLSGGIDGWSQTVDPSVPRY
jgi:adenylyltransferase/sulfurtransferase